MNINTDVTLKWVLNKKIGFSFRVNHVRLALTRIYSIFAHSFIQRE